METADKLPVQIVIAEDNPADVKLVHMALRDAGLNCSLRIVGDGAQAIALIETLDADSKAAPIDLLLLDMHLPKYDGEDVLKRLRSTDLNLPKKNGEDVLRRLRSSAKCGRTLVLVVTSSDSARDREPVAALGIAGYFKKPSEYAEFMKLGSIVKRLLEETTPSADAE